MKYFLLFILFLTFSLAGQSQVGKTKPDMQDIKSQMVLRANTRDKVAIVNDNSHRSQMQVRRQIIQGQQQKIMRQHMNHIQKQRIYRQRMLQLRKKRREAARRRHFHGR